MMVNKILIRAVGVLLITMMGIFGGFAFVMYRVSNTKQAIQALQE
jgi:hypothetical protein